MKFAMCGLVGSAVAAVLAMSGAAQASSLSTYNVIVFNNMTTQSSDIGGPVLVGNNLTVTNQTDFKNSLTVNGQITGSFTLDGGTLQYGVGPLPSFNNNAHAIPVNSTFGGLAAVESEILGDASSFAAMTTNSTTSLSGNTLNFNASGSGAAVFNVDASIFASSTLSNLILNMGSATSVIINVTDTSNNAIVYGNGGENFGGAFTTSPTKVIWNFIQPNVASPTTSITVDKQFEGSILAPWATVANNNGAIEGTVAAYNFNMNGEVHPDQFTGSVPSSGPSIGVVVPLPPAVASGTLVMLGLVGMGIVRRRSLRRN